MSDRDRPSLGISLRILAGILSAGMFVCVKAAGPNVPLGEVVFFRSFFAVIALILFLWVRGEFPGGLATKRPFQHLIRPSFGAISLFTSFAALANGSAGDARLWGIGLALVSAVLSALALLMVRSLNKTESPGAIAMYFVIASMVGALCTLPWGWIVPDLPTPLC